MVKTFCCFNATLPAALVLSVPLSLVSQSSAQALSFRFSFDSNAPDEFQAAVKDAGRTWSSLLQDDVVVDLQIKYTDLSSVGGDVLGGAQPGKIKVNYADYVSAAFNDVVSNNDYRGVNSLQLNSTGRQQVEKAQWDSQKLYSDPGLSSQQFSFLADQAFGAPAGGSIGQNSSSPPPEIVYRREAYTYEGNYYPAYLVKYENGEYTSVYEYEEGYSELDSIDSYYSNYQHSYQGGGQSSAQTSEGYVDDNSSKNNSNVSLTKAQAKALGLLNPKDRGLDGVISINSTVNWDFSQDDGVESDRYDVTTVLQHEIGHALGLVSGVDAADYLISSGQADDADLDNKKGFSYLTPMDFYRYSDESAELGVADLTLGGEKYFSLDGGKSVERDRYGREAYFSTGSTQSGGDGYQGSHWQEGNNNPLGVMNPTLQKGKANGISELDLTLLDVVGWDLENSLQKKASAIDVDWQGLQNNLTSNRQQAIDKTINKWSDDIPALEAAIEDAIVEVDIAFSKQVQDKFDVLSNSIRKGDKDYQDYQSEVDAFYEDVSEDAAERDQQIKSLPYEIYNTDAKVRGWLELPTEELSKEMRAAEIQEINRLSNIVKAAPVEDRLALEAKLREAVAPFADQPTQLVQELLDSSGPANPIGYGNRRRWWFFFQLGEDDRGKDGDGLTYYSEMAFQLAGSSTDTDSLSAVTQPIRTQPGIEEPELPIISGLQPVSPAAIALSTYNTNAANAAKINDPTDIPEPSTVLSIFGIAVLGAAGCKRGRAKHK